MTIGEVFLSAFISVLFEKLVSGELLKLPCIKGIDDKIKKWRKDLSMISAVLHDAEERQITDVSVQLWLKELQDLAYDMDDMLDELNTDLLSLCKEPESISTTSKVRKIIPTCFTSCTPSAFILDIIVSRKIDEITRRLDDLTKQNDVLGLTKRSGGRSDSVGKESRATSSLVKDSIILGRAEEKAAICKLLLEERNRNHDGEGRNVFVIPILGMGGLGKTTLAQLIFNDEQVEAHFDHRAWVCVSEDFDLLRISNLIYDSVAKANEEFKDLNSVQVRLKEKLTNKRFLVVLDDVWDESYAKWDQFRVPFLFGAPGSTIIVTTRIGEIAQLMGSMEAYNLKPIQDSDCISLLAHHALEKPNFDTLPHLKETGVGIARKCGGLPLAAKSLGGVLRTKTSLDQWQKVLDSKFWDLGTRNNEILPALRLSYYHLPPHLKPLFVYCSIFPKGYEFEKDDLILLWMAEGLLAQTGDNMRMEELGLEYFNELLSRSFFQCSGDEKSRFLMHDLINDLALFVAGNVCFRLDEEMKSKVQSSFSEKVRYSSFIRQTYGTYKKFTPYSEVVHLRTFIPIAVGNSRNFYLSNLVLNDLLPRLRCLRVLSLTGYRVSGLPSSIGNLKHLRYLNMSKTDITQLPESVCELYNLQTLLLKSCDKLIQLPTSIRNLVNLRHLDISSTPKFKWMPYGIGTLSSLCTLSKVVIGKRNGFQLNELKGLSDLKGTLTMVGMQNIGSVTEAREANISGKGCLDRLAMRWSGKFEDCRDEDIERQVLDVLNPQPGLQRLEIAYYGGTSFPKWVGDPSFSKMVHLTLSGCKNCTSLPSLGHLRSLKELFIKGMGGVKVVGIEFYGDGSTEVGVFPSLEVLSFEQMISWEAWSSNFINGDQNGNAVFPRLGKLTMDGCRKLVKVCLPMIPSLSVLEIGECSEALLRSMVGIASVKTLDIWGIVGLTQLDEGIIRFLGPLEDLRISGCSELRYLWKEEVARVVLTKLRVLEVSDCGQLESLGENDQVLPHNLRRIKLSGCDSLEKISDWCESLRQLEISSCKKLKYIPSTKQLVSKTENNKVIATTESSSSSSNNNDQMEGFPNLEILYVSTCPRLTSLPTGEKFPSTLKHLYIIECENIEEPEEVHSNEKIWLHNSMSSLESIYVHRSVNLKPLWDGFFFRFGHLTHLLIVSCEGIVSIPERCFPPALMVLRIQDCKNLKSLLFCGDDLVSLEELLITDCEKLETYSRGRWPPNLKSLIMGDVKQPITEWGLHLHTLPTSLTHLKLCGKFPELVSLSDLGSRLPTSLTRLEFRCPINLKSLSDGLQNLTSLAELCIHSCPKLRSLPNMLLPALSNLQIKDCPLIKERCGKDRGDYWARIAHIPCIKIDGELVWGL